MPEKKVIRQLSANRWFAQLAITMAWRVHMYPKSGTFPVVRSTNLPLVTGRHLAIILTWLKKRKMASQALLRWSLRAKIGKINSLHLVTIKLKHMSCQIAFTRNYRTKWSRMDARIKKALPCWRKYAKMFASIKFKAKEMSQWIRFGSKKSKTKCWETSHTRWATSSTMTAWQTTGPGPTRTNSAAAPIEKRSLKANLTTIFDFWKSTTCRQATRRTCYNSSALTSATAGPLAYPFRALPTNTAANTLSSKNDITSNKPPIAWRSKWITSREWRRRHASWVSNSSRSRIARTLQRSWKWSKANSNCSRPKRKIRRRIWITSRCYKSVHGRKQLKSRWLKM